MASQINHIGNYYADMQSGCVLVAIFYLPGVMATYFKTPVINLSKLLEYGN